MDIVIAIFLFIIGFVLVVIGIPKRNDDISYRTITFMALGGMVFLMLGVLTIMDPIETVSGFVSVENVSVVNQTTINTTFEFREFNNGFNNTLGLLFVGVSLFVMFFSLFLFWELRTSGGGR